MRQQSGGSQSTKLPLIKTHFLRNVASGLFLFNRSRQKQNPRSFQGGGFDNPYSDSEDD